MDENAEQVLKKLCCTCLSHDRRLFQLCRIHDGVNNLYLLLSFDAEAYREGFYKETASLFICWECRAIMYRVVRFREQACVAQRQLTLLAEGRINIKTKHSLSHLTKHHISTYETVTSSSDSIDNFIDCGPVTDIKSESDEDVPLSKLHNNLTTNNEQENKIADDYYINGESDYENGESYLNNGESNHKDQEDAYENGEDKSQLHKYVRKESKHKTRKKVKDQAVLNTENNKEYINISILNEDELKQLRINCKMAPAFVASQFKCESCLEIFDSFDEMVGHNSILHSKKLNHAQCVICLGWIKSASYNKHMDTHYEKYECKLCQYICYNRNDTLIHLRNIHEVDNSVLPVKSKKSKRTEAKSDTESRRKVMMDKKTAFGYLCSECNVYFENKNQRWKHVQRQHREGYKCDTCGKRFAFNNNLARHQLLHQGPPPREECATCHKMVRTDLMKVHSRIHAARERFHCALCAKCFVSRASYEHHLKYTQPHASTPAVLRYKCSMCDKGYRSRGELRDHVNYQHMGKTQHKCPVCGKALATRRCITRHVRRAHEGVKESARDKICQQCGKAFRDKKGLREHELIHTGERPLSCELCGCTFRQSASLYTHRKRVHKIYPNKKIIELLES